MQSNDKIKEIDIKNPMCYYFDDITKIEYFNLDNIYNINIIFTAGLNILFIYKCKKGY